MSLGFARIKTASEKKYYMDQKQNPFQIFTFFTQEKKSNGNGTFLEMKIL